MGNVFFSLVLSILLLAMQWKLFCQYHDDYPCSKQYHVDNFMFERCFHMANGQRAIGDYENALINFQNLLESAERNNDLYRIAQIKLHISMVYHDRFDSAFNKNYYNDYLLYENDSLKMLNYLNLSIKNVTEAVSIFETVLRKGLVESSYINSVIMLDTLRKLRMHFISDNINPSIIQVYEENINKIKNINDKLQAITIANMEYNYNELEYIKANRVKDSVWLNFTRFLYKNESICDISYINNEYFKIDSSIKNLILTTTIIKQQNEAGYDEYIFDGIEPQNEPNMYAHRINEMIDNIQIITKRIRNFSDILKECIKYKEKINVDEISIVDNFIGFKVGINHSFYTGTESPKQAQLNPNIITGIFFEIGITENNYLSIQPEILFTLIGAKWQSTYLNEYISYRSSMNYLDFGMLIKWKVLNPIEIFIGPGINYLADINELSFLKGSTNDNEYIAYINDFQDLPKWDYGLTIGIDTYKFSIFYPVFVSFEVRYMINFNNFNLIIPNTINYKSMNNNYLALSLNVSFKL